MAGEEMLAPTHFVYESPNTAILCQGDVLKRTSALDAHLKEFHPYYGDHEDYHYFMVVTQSCDLAIRKGQSLPNSPYITIAAVRPLREALLREAAKIQDPWQKETRVISEKIRTKLAMFLESLFDNNRPGYFYLHQDIGLGIQDNYCAFLHLAVALKALHYPMCLEAKVAQLKEPFQAKLGYQIGHMYSRVGTAEWNSNVPDKSVAKFASEVLKRSFIIFDDAQIDEGMQDLRQSGSLSTTSPEQIKEYINKKKVVSRKQKFHDAAVELLSTRISLVNLLAGRVHDPLKSDLELTHRLEEVLSSYEPGSEETSSVIESLVQVFLEHLGHHLSDEGLQGKRDVYEKVFSTLLQDISVSNILR